MSQKFVKSDSDVKSEELQKLYSSLDKSVTMLTTQIRSAVCCYHLENNTMH